MSAKGKDTGIFIFKHPPGLTYIYRVGISCRQSWHVWAQGQRTYGIFIWIIFPTNVKQNCPINCTDVHSLKKVVDLGVYCHY